jgi:hypothetical protein
VVQFNDLFTTGVWLLLYRTYSGVNSWVGSCVPILYCITTWFCDSLFYCKVTFLRSTVIKTPWTDSLLHEMMQLLLFQKKEDERASPGHPWNVVIDIHIITNVLSNFRKHKTWTVINFSVHLLNFYPDIWAGK